MAFKFTVVKDYTNYWVDQAATNNVIITKRSVVSVEPDTEPEGEPEGEPEPEVEPENEREPQSEAEKVPAKEELHVDYEGCKTKGCFGGNAECVEQGNCEILTVFSYDGQAFKFLLHEKCNW